MNGLVRAWGLWQTSDGELPVILCAGCANERLEADMPIWPQGRARGDLLVCGDCGRECEGDE